MREILTNVVRGYPSAAHKKQMPVNCLITVVVMRPRRKIRTNSLTNYMMFEQLCVIQFSYTEIRGTYHELLNILCDEYPIIYTKYLDVEFFVMLLSDTGSRLEYEN